MGSEMCIRDSSRRICSRVSGETANGRLTAARVYTKAELMEPGEDFVNKVGINISNILMFIKKNLDKRQLSQKAVRYFGLSGENFCCAEHETQFSQLYARFAIRVHCKRSNEALKIVSSSRKRARKMTKF